MATPTVTSGAVLLPGTLIGGFCGLVAGALVGLVGQDPLRALVSAVALAVPLALAGAGFEWLAGTGIVRPSVFATAALFWLAGFPLARLLHEVLFGLAVAGRPVLPADVLAFLAFQGLISPGYAIGFCWLRERIVRRREEAR